MLRDTQQAREREGEKLLCKWLTTYKLYNIELEAGNWKLKL